MKITPILLKYLAKDVVPFFLLEDKKLQVNPIVENSIPFVLVPNESNGDSILAVSANSNLSWDLSNDQSGFLDIRKLQVLATSMDFLIEITESKRSSLMSNKPIHAKTIIGIQGRAFTLPYPIVLPKLQSLRVNLTDLSGSLNNIRLAFQGYKYFSGDEKILKENNILHEHIKPYFYTTDSNVSLAGNASTTNYISIDGGNFLCYGMSAHSTGDFKYKIYDVNLGRAWQNGYIASYNLGTGEYQNTFDFPILLKRKTQMKIDFANLTASPNNIYLTLHGIFMIE